VRRDRARTSPALHNFPESRRPTSKKNSANRILDQTIVAATDAKILDNRSTLTAIDGSGFESHHTSRYFVRRRDKAHPDKQSMTYRRFPKVGLVCDCASHMILAAIPGRGPTPDHPHLVEVMRAATARRPIDTLLADAGYDGEWVHAFLGEDLSIRSIIPPKTGRPTTKLPTGHYRRRMHYYFQRPKDQRKYGQRWQVETVMSMIKRRLGETLAARSYRRQCRTMLLKVIAHNVLILFLWKVFYRASLTPFRPDPLPPSGPECRCE
jgi:transposase